MSLITFSLDDEKVGFSDHLQISNAPESVFASTVPPGAQASEPELVNDLFLVLNLGQGDYIRFAETYDPLIWDDRIRGPEYSINFSMNVPVELVEIIDKAAEIASYAHVVREFVATFSDKEFGTVNQSLCSGLRQLFRIYLDNVSKLEVTMSTLKLSDIWEKLEHTKVHLKNSKLLIDYLMQKSEAELESKSFNSAGAFQTGDKLVLRGGKMLRSLSEYQLAIIGDVEALNLCDELLQISSKPYLDALNLWFNTGRLTDDLDEFMVRLDTHINRDNSLDFSVNFSDHYFALKIEDMPLQLSAPVTQNSLLEIGNYLQILRVSKGIENLDIDFGFSKCSSIEDPAVMTCIQHALENANDEVKKLVRSSKFNISGLMDKIKSLYLLTDAGILPKLVAETDPELSEPVAEMDLNVIDNAMNRISDLGDIWSPFIKPSFATTSIYDALTSLQNGELVEPKDQEGLTGLSSLEIEFRPPFPVSFIVSDFVLKRYNLIFRYLVQLKGAYERLLQLWHHQTTSQVWKSLNGYSSSNQFSQDESLDEESPVEWLRSIITARNKLLHVIRLVYSHTMESMLAGFEELVKELTTLDSLKDISSKHKQFLDHMLDASLMMDPKIVRSVHKLISLANKFCSYITECEHIIAAFLFPGTSLQTDLQTQSSEPVAPDVAYSWFKGSYPRYISSIDRLIKKLHVRLNNCCHERQELSVMILQKQVSYLVDDSLYEY